MNIERLDSESAIKIPSLYEIDYQLWLDQTLEQLRSHNFTHLDLDNLIEEVESLGKSEKHAIEPGGTLFYPRRSARGRLATLETIRINTRNSPES